LDYFQFYLIYFFIVQHYILYRTKQPTVIRTNDNDDDNNEHTPIFPSHM